MIKIITILGKSELAQIEQFNQINLIIPCVEFISYWGNQMDSPLRGMNKW